MNTGPGKLVLLLLLFFPFITFAQSAKKIIESNNYHDTRVYFQANPGELREYATGTLLPIHLAARDGYFFSLKAILELDTAIDPIFVNSRDEKHSPLTLAAFNKNWDCAALLYEHGADTSFITSDGQHYYDFFTSDYTREFFEKAAIRPKQWKLDFGLWQAGENLSAIDSLIRLGADINSRSPHGWNALHLACRDGKYSMASELLKRGANPDIKGNEGYTALHLAARNDYILIYDLLIQENAASDAENDNLQTPFKLASELEGEWVLAYIKDPENTLSLYKECEKLWNTLRNGKHEKLYAWNDRPEIWSKRNPQGHTILHLAIMGGSEKCVDWALKHPEFLNVKDDYKQSPLYLSISWTFPYAYYKLLKLDADTGFGDLNTTRYAIATGISAAARAMVLNPAGYYYLIQVQNALKAGKTSSIRSMMKEKDFTVNFFHPESGAGIIHWACAYGNEDLINYCIRNKQDFFVPADGTPAMEYLCRTDRLDLVDRVFNYSGRWLSTYKCGHELEKKSSGYFQFYLTENEKALTAWLFNEAIANSRTAEAKKLWRKNPDIGLSDENGRTVLHFAARQGLSEWVKLLLEKGAASSKKDLQGVTPLYLAIYNLKYSCIKLLVANENRERLLRDPLYAKLLASRKEVRLLLEDEAQFDRQFTVQEEIRKSLKKKNYPEAARLLKALSPLKDFRGEDGATLLHYAVELNDTVALELLLANGVPANVLNDDSRNALFTCFSLERFNLADVLLKYGADLSAEDDEGMTPDDLCASVACLEYSTKWQKKTIQRLKCELIYTKLLNEDLAEAKLYTCDLQNWLDIDNGEGLLHAAVWSGSADAVKWVLSMGVPIDQFAFIGDSSYTPLMLSLYLGNYNLTALLVELGADPHLKNLAKKNSFDLANNQPMLVKLLNGHKTTLLSVELVYAVKEKNLVRVKEVLAAGADPDLFCLRSGFYPIHFAARSGNVEMVYTLLNAGADPAIKLPSGSDPLYLALYNDNPDAAWLLLKHGAELNVKTRNMDDSSDLAIVHPEMYREILEGKTRGVENYFRDSSLYQAMKANDSTLLKYLGAIGKNIYTTENDGWNGFHYISRYGLKTLVSLYAGSDSLLNRKTNEGFTPFHLAVINGENEIAKELIAIGADTSIKTGTGITWIDLALEYGQNGLLEEVISRHPEVIKRAYWEAITGNNPEKAGLLLREGHVSVNDTTAGSFSALHFAARDGYQYEEMCRTLLSFKPDINAKNATGWTPLMLAVWNGNIIVADMLVNAGADVSVKNHADSTAKDLAAESLNIHSRNFFSNPEKTLANYNLVLGVFLKDPKRIKLALSTGAEPDEKDGNGWTSVAYCMREAENESARLLLQSGANPNTVVFASDYGELSPLRLAIWNNNFEGALLLIQAGADTRYVDGKGVKLEDAAREKGALFSLLLEDPAKAKQQYDLNTLLFKAISFDSPILIDQALYLGADPEMRNPESGLTPLIHACQTNKTQAVETLLKRGVNTETGAEFSDGYFTPAMIAAINSAEPVTVALINAGAEMDWVNKKKDISYLNDEFIADLEIINRNPRLHKEIWQLIDRLDTSGFNRLLEYGNKNDYYDFTASEKKMMWLLLSKYGDSSWTFINQKLPAVNDLNWFESMIDYAVANKSGLFYTGTVLKTILEQSGMAPADFKRANVSEKKGSNGLLLKQFIDSPETFPEKFNLLTRFVENPSPEGIPPALYGWPADAKNTIEVWYLAKFPFKKTTDQFRLAGVPYRFYKKEDQALLIDEMMALHLAPADITGLFPDSLRMEVLNYVLRKSVENSDTVLFQWVMAGSYPFISQFKKVLVNDWKYQNLPEMIISEGKANLFLPLLPEDSLKHPLIISGEHPLNAVLKAKNRQLFQYLLRLYTPEIKSNQLRPDFLFTLVERLVFTEVQETDTSSSYDALGSYLLTYLLKNYREYLKTARYKDDSGQDYDLLQYALVNYADASIVASLLKSGWDTRWKNSSGQTALPICNAQKLGLFRLMLLDPPSAERWVQLDRMLDSENPELVKPEWKTWLLAYRDNYGNTALHLAPRSGDLRLLEYLLKIFPDNGLRDNEGRNFVHRIIYYGKGDWLKKFPVDPKLLKSQDNKGNTPLHLAVEERDLGAIKILSSLTSGYPANNEGQTPLQFAVQMQCAYCQQLILNPSAPLPPKTSGDMEYSFNNLMNEFKYSDAFALAEQRAELVKKVYGEISSEYVSALSDMALASGFAGNIGRGTIIISQSLELARKLYHDDPYNLAESLMEACVFNRFSGNYINAIALSEEAFVLYKDSYRASAGKFIGVLDAINECSIKTGRKDRLPGNYQRFRPFLKDLEFGDMISLADILETSGDTIQPRWYYARAWEKFINSPVFYFDFFAHETRMLAGELNANNDTAKLEQMQLLAEETIKAGKLQNPEKTQSLLAYLYKSQDKYGAAAGIYRQVILKTQTTAASSDFTLNKWRLDLARIYISLDSHKAALELAEQVADSRIALIQENFSYLSEQGKNSFIESWESDIDLFRYLSVNTTGENNISNLFLKENMVKGIALNSSIYIRNFMRESTDPVIVSKRTAIQRMRETLVTGKQRFTGSEDPAFRKISDSVKMLEAEISQLAFADFIKKLEEWGNLEKVKKQLGDKELFVQFIRVPVDEDGDEFRYVAICISKKDLPVIVDICDENSLKELLKGDENTGIQNKVNQLYATRGAGEVNTSIASSGLYNLLWSRLESVTKSYSSISIVPVGYLNKVAFAALYSGERSLLEDHRIRMLTHPSALFNHERFDPLNGGTFILAGGLDFGKRNGLIAPENQLASRGGSGLRQEWSYLPGTYSEIQRLGNLATKDRIRISLYSDTLFSENAFRQITGTTRGVLHIATHGFYLPGFSANNDGAFSYDPLQDAGLILSGGNLGWTGVVTSGGNDGVLSGTEIATMDLGGIGLVTLSACETGLGEIKGNEGVFGLNRAFKLAGTRYIITSLWQVPDKQTADFMNLFYGKWLGGMEITEAFYQTQLEMSRQYAAWYWAGFVLSE